MQRMKMTGSRPVVCAYCLSIAVWCGLSLLTGWQYRIFDAELNLSTSLSDMMLLAESRGFAFALLTPPIFYLARRYIDGARDRYRYVFIYGLGVGPFMLLYACIRWTLLSPWNARLRQYVPRSAL